MAPRSYLEFVAQYGGGHPDIRTALNVLEIIIPGARQWAQTDAERAMVDAAEAQARATVQQHLLEEVPA
jgi:hypothetical protein